MAVQKNDIFVFADWLGLEMPKLVGVLTIQEARGKSSFGFSYESSWLETEKALLLDPDIEWYSGIQVFSIQNPKIFLECLLIRCQIPGVEL